MILPAWFAWFALILCTVTFVLVYWVLGFIILLLKAYQDGARYCCMVRPWHMHLTDDLSEEDGSRKISGYAGMGFSVTHCDLDDYELSLTLAHENRHVIHFYIGGITYGVLYGISERFRCWAENNCRQAERKPLYCRNAS